MDRLYTTTTLACSKLITQHYSTSFTLGIKTLHKRFHLPIYAIYGFVRYADEIVDTFHEFDKEKLLREFKEDTFKSIKEGISLNPVLHSFQLIVNQYKIDHDLILAFLRSMEMDLDKASYNDDGYDEYIYGSAEVVGLMCLRVFCEGDESYYESLKDSAKSLGSAFQKVNFLRDMKSDYKDRGRVYFPGVDFEAFGKKEKLEIEKDIDKDFEHALQGIRNLPTGSRSGVYLAYVYYIRLFEKIKKVSSSKIKQERIRIPDFHKFVLLAKTLLLNKFNAIQ
ncbi:MAG: phytoene/squalene synthase family protein [Cyclobacteriaceae bacterium]